MRLGQDELKLLKTFGYRHSLGIFIIEEKRSNFKLGIVASPLKRTARDYKLLLSNFEYPKE